ncbi:hypothetical protein COM13_12280 [Bacillus pseudomycoides]|uniref:tail fiber domain-containing protein n=1 Tax=Bacillus pseudomycoides TaxID=64104 RepID=UPI000BED3528|nr:tail fiber domain-containing protein [Bacillus pseudomycoides]PDX97509.1 hypothetical protein COO07_27000 [Bacillus pseudomycoides]PEK78116.1 hypothetical protein CN597_17230 [Bacillus pseudomycoides]PEN01381.1 hypothetical protein CN640_28840 [Bacillus pseudomycoides]PGB89077.1 hypothetical protein COM13_12280 [Bacillus pseudomycoides]PHE55249.1 hypothetical protein COF52_16595 [Bacillus pseudomycoides]
MPNVVGDSNTQNVPGVFGNNTNGGTGVFGQSINGWGTSGRSETNTGVSGLSTSGIGVVGGSQGGWGVYANSSTNTSLYAEGGSRDGTQPVLVVKQLGSGHLINGLDRSGNRVFEVSDYGGVSIAGGIGVGRSIRVVNEIMAGGEIRTSNDVYARGVKLTSDKNAKENFSNVNTLEILDNLASMPILSWNYKEDPSSKRHIGPTAQDFQANFGLNGDDNKHISSVDIQGVALAAIQGLNEKLQAENAGLYAKLASFEERLSALESKG